MDLDLGAFLGRHAPFDALDDDTRERLAQAARVVTFDSGDLRPGLKADVTFPVRGAFTVLCGVHPKMKLQVQVN